MTDPQYPSYPGPEQPPGYHPPPRYQQPAPQYGEQPPAYGAPSQHSSAPIGYASWWSRVAATIVDALIVLAVAIVPMGLGAYLAFRDVSTDPATGETTGAVNGAGLALLALGYALIFVFSIWNTVFRQGRTGQTLGKSALGIQVVKADTGQFIGAGTAFGRWIVAAIIGGLCFLDYLWPLWDAKKQTLHDKVIGSVVTKK